MDFWGSPLIIADMPPRMPWPGLRGLFRAQALESVFTREDEPSIPQAGVDVLVVRIPRDVAKGFPAVRAARWKMREDRALCRVMTKTRVSVDRSGENRSHAQHQTILGAGFAGGRMTTTYACGMPMRMGRKQSVAATISGCSGGVRFVASGDRICQLCDRADATPNPRRASPSATRQRWP